MQGGVGALGTGGAASRTGARSIAQTARGVYARATRRCSHFVATVWTFCIQDSCRLWIERPPLIVKAERSSRNDFTTTVTANHTYPEGGNCICCASSFACWH